MISFRFAIHQFGDPIATIGLAPALPGLGFLAEVESTISRNDSELMREGSLV